MTDLERMIEHHKKYGDMVRTSNGHLICGLAQCALHYPKVLHDD